MHLFSTKIIQAVCWTLLHSLWQGLLLALITGLLMMLSKKTSSAIRYKLLSVLFVLFLITVCLTFYRELQLAPSDKPVETAVSSGPAIQPPAPPVAAAKDTYKGSTLQYYITAFTDYFNANAFLVVTIWFIVFMAKCVKLFSGLLYIQRIRNYKIKEAPGHWKERMEELGEKLGIKKRIELLESAIVKVPVVVGWLKPAILIPLGLLTQLTPAEVESVLMHELAHIRRRDYFFNLMQSFVDTLFFFNPAILWISSLIRNERENCCDDIAINETKSKKQFIQALLSFYQYNQPDAHPRYALSFAKRKNRLVNRVKRIVNNNNQTLNPGEKIILISGLFLFSIVFIGISRGQDNSPKKQAAQNKTVSKKTRSQKPVQQTVKPVAAKADKKSALPVKSDDEAAPEQDTPIVNVNVDVHPVITAKLDVKTNTNVNVETDMELSPDADTSRDGDDDFSGLGYGNIPLEKLEALKSHGVDPEFIERFQKGGYKDISLDQAILLKDHGVDMDFIDGFHRLGYTNISLDEAQNLKDHGVSGRFIRNFHELGYKNISLEEATSLKDHSVNAAFIGSLKEIGYNDISLEKASELRDHGVNADFINGFIQSGFKNISLDKAQQLRDHGVSVGFINAVRKKIGGDLSLDEYISLRDHGGL